MASILRYYEGAKPNISKRKSTATPDQVSSVKRKTYENVRDRVFQSHWLVGREWLDYDKSEGLMRCRYCREKTNKQGSGKWLSQIWIDGTNNFKIDGIKAHEKSSFHKDAEKAYVNKHQPAKSEGVTAMKQLSVAQIQNLRYKFRNAHAVAKQDFSFLDYVALCRLDRAKNLDSGVTYENDKSCRTFVHHIAMVETEKTVKMLSDASFFSITIDGATDISGVEVESIYVHSCHRGERSQRFLGFVSPNSTTSADIHSSVVSLLKERGIDPKKQVGLTTDGASNMLGVKKGLATLMKKDCPDLISVHCLAHRLELAIKDAIKLNETVKKNYEKCMTLLIGLYYFYKKSPKQRKHLENTFEILKLPKILPIRAGGTRWIPHTTAAIATLMKSVCAIVTQLHDASHTTPKAEGLVKLLTDFNLFTFMMVLKEVMSPIATLSKSLQNDQATIADAFFMVDSAKEMLENFGHENSEELQEVCSTKEYKGVALKGNTPTLSYRQALVKAILKCLDGRFTAERNFYESANIVNFLIWPGIQDTSKKIAFGDKEIKFLMKHFEGRFQDLEPDALLTEWRKLKTIVYQRYRSPREIETLEWCSVHKATKYQGVEDVLSLIDLILSLPPTSVCNERSFSHMKLIKGDKRSRLSTEAMSDVMIVKSLTPPVEDFDPEEAINRFLMKTPSGRVRRPDFSRRLSHHAAAIPALTLEEETIEDGADQAQACKVHDDEDNTVTEEDESDHDEIEPGYDVDATFERLKVLNVHMEMELEHEKD